MVPLGRTIMGTRHTDDVSHPADYASGLSVGNADATAAHASAASAPTDRPDPGAARVEPSDDGDLAPFRTLDDYERQFRRASPYNLR
jgi:hypothetical protein